MDVRLPVNEKSIRKTLRPFDNSVLVPVKGKAGEVFVRVDPVDSYLKSFTWTEDVGGYPRRSASVKTEDAWKTKTFYLHKQLAGLTVGDTEFQVHHANHDVYDCRRVNLWLVTPKFNLRHQKRSRRTMLEELWATPKERLECWPLGDAKASIAHLIELHRLKRGSYPLDLIASSLAEKLADR